MAPQLSFNPNDVPESRFEPIPAGWYLMAATSSELKTNKKKNGEYLQFSFQVLEGSCRNRTIFARFTWSHSESEKAVEIGKRQFADLCNASGLNRQIDSTEELHGIPLDVRVNVREHKDFGPSNDVDKFARAGSRTKAA